MREWSVMLALCIAACSAVLGARAAGEDAARWQNLIAEYLRSVPLTSDPTFTGLPGTTATGARTVGTAVSWASWFPPPMPTLMHAEGGRSMPVLVVPVPVPIAAPSNAAQCPLSPQPARAITYDSYSPPASPPVPAAPDVRINYGDVPAFNPTFKILSPKPELPPQPPAPSQVSSSRPLKDERYASYGFRFPPVEDSSLLVEQFLAQEPRDPTLPPIVIRISDPQVPTERKRITCKKRIWKAGMGEAPPPPPHFDSSIFLQGRLFVQRAGFTEPFSIWWDATSGASRMDFHDGSTSTYRMMKRDGRLQSVQIRVDRTGTTDVRRCIVTSPRRITLAERSLPALPDLRFFSFAGYVQRGAERTERWRYTLSGHSGELGGVRGEALTFRHELLVRRAPDNFTTTPLRYAVRVDSSVLGVDSDSYVLYFDDVQRQHYDSAMFNLNIEDACDFIKNTSRIDIVEPLREFTMLNRDPRYDVEINQFKKKYQRVYRDVVEEAVRKNVLMQTVRYTASGNRQGASYEMGINFLSDRLVVEYSILLGVEQTPFPDSSETYPHTLSELEALRGRIRLRFDWRELGAVTDVRFQGNCSSCWAFATTGAVEGALFVETGRLVPLSEQALVDCSMQWSGNGCMPTWPNYAYEYIKERGLPARDDYTPYQAEVTQCRADSVPSVTRISGHVNITVMDPIALQVAIKENGPIVVLINVPEGFDSYKKGYYFAGNCLKKQPNHAMLAVGWVTFREETYFILKNSWGLDWGMEGYVYLRGSDNTCGVLNKASYPRLQRRDVEHLPTVVSSPS